MRQWAWVGVALLVAGCATPGGNKGLERVSFSEPYAEAKPRMGPGPERGKGKVSSRADILGRLSTSPQDAREIERVVEDEGKVTPAAFWTGSRALGDGVVSLYDGVDWKEGAVVTPNAPTLAGVSGTKALEVVFLEVLVGMEWDLATMAEENRVVVNMAAPLGAPPDETMLCFGSIHAPVALAPPTDPYMIVIGITPTSKDPADFEHLRLYVSGESVSFSATGSEIMALVDLCQGGHLVGLTCDKWAVPFVISYVKVMKL